MKYDHVETHKSGMPMCRHCGGEVGEDGYSRGGIVDEDEGEAEKMREGFVEGDETPEQGVAAERLSDAAFVDTIKRRRGGG